MGWFNYWLVVRNPKRKLQPLAHLAVPLTKTKTEENNSISWNINGAKHQDVINLKGLKGYFVSKWQLICPNNLPIPAEKSPMKSSQQLLTLLEQNEDYKKLKTVPV